MPTLHWIGKDKVINHHLDVPFKVLEHKYTFSSESEFSGFKDEQNKERQQNINSVNFANSESDSFLGKHYDTGYYFNYEQDAATTLDYAFLVNMHSKADQYVTYADNCLLTKNYMTKHHFIFKKKPRDITKF